eukprot:360137-Chlamydomonas_euryale.AAC.2
MSHGASQEHTVQYSNTRHIPPMNGTSRGRTAHPANARHIPPINGTSCGRTAHPADARQFPPTHGTSRRCTAHPADARHIPPTHGTSRKRTAHSANARRSAPPCAPISASTAFEIPTLMSVMSCFDARVTTNDTWGLTACGGAYMPMSSSKPGKGPNGSATQARRRCVSARRLHDRLCKPGFSMHAVLHDHRRTTRHMTQHKRMQACTCRRAHALHKCGHILMHAGPHASSYMQFACVLMYAWSHVYVIENMLSDMHP